MVALIVVVCLLIVVVFVLIVAVFVLIFVLVVLIVVNSITDRNLCFCHIDHEIMYIIVRVRTI